MLEAVLTCSVYPHYDIVIWSQTHWRWLESKLVELGVIGGSRNYKICFVADRTCMFPVSFLFPSEALLMSRCSLFGPDSLGSTSEPLRMRNGSKLMRRVKPLAYFWATYPQWSAKNVSWRCGDD